MSTQEYEIEIARLKAENEKLAKAKSGKLTLKVSEKGAVSVYGLGRFPVTLYGEQWHRLLGEAPRIADFLVANQDKLSTK